jgi:hypothetical protein
MLVETRHDANSVYSSLNSTYKTNLKLPLAKIIVLLFLAAPLQLKRSYANYQSLVNE